jgi:arsenite-transporting ATPase
MAFILTFLGKGGTGRTTIAIATAKKYANQGQKVLLIGQDQTPAFSLQLGETVNSTPTQVESNLDVVQLQSTYLLEQAWEQLKDLEAKYLRSPVLKNIYGVELGVLPGMDQALALNFIREQEETNKYDVIIYDGLTSISSLRMFGVPNVASWYFRRMRQILEQSDIVKALSPFVQPVSSAVFTVSWTPDDFASQPAHEANNLLDKGKVALADPQRIAAFLVTTSQPEALATAKYLWGSSQQVGLTIGGVLLNQATVSSEITSAFEPLPVTYITTKSGQDWLPLISTLPDFKHQAIQAPKPITIDTLKREVKVFLPGFDKKQVKLSQSGPEITIDAGDQRHNIFLPPPLKGQSVKGAKFQNGYLIISL